MRYIVAITGASGAVYAQKVIAELLKLKARVHLSISPTGFRIINEELGVVLDEKKPEFGEFLPDIDVTGITYCRNDDLGAVPASGSWRHNGMIIVPCSAGTLARVAAGVSRTLIERAADCALKEQRPCVAVVRETPLSTIHLNSMLAFAGAGGTVLPASPAFYTKPGSIDDIAGFIAGKALDCLGLEHNLYEPYTGIDD